MTDKLSQLASELLVILREKNLSIVTAESCTAGLLCQVLSDAEGAAEFFHGGFVTYTKRHKSRALGVSADLLRTKGAVCREVACAMAEGALERSDADLCAAITGVAGPEPDPDGNPVGLVCVAITQRQRPTRSIERNYGNAGRTAVRQAAVAEALAGLIQAAKAVPVNKDGAWRRPCSI